MVRDLVRAAYARWIPFIGQEPGPMLADYDKAVRDHLIDLMETEGRVAGLIEMVPQADHLWVENIALHPNEQGRGLGAHLLARAEERAAALGLPELRLLTNEAFAANIALYERHGYAVTKREPFVRGIAVHMSKRLG